MGILGANDVNWEKLGCNTATILHLYRSKVPGGWLVVVVGGESESASLTFYPDPEHQWDGRSLD